MNVLDTYCYSFTDHLKKKSCAKLVPTFSDYFKYQGHSTCDSYIQPETSSESSKPIPKYLEILFDENTDNIPNSNPYEIPLPSEDVVSVCSDSLPPQRDVNFEEGEESRDVTNIYENAKERLLSSSSTLSEAVI